MRTWRYGHRILSRRRQLRPFDPRGYLESRTMARRCLSPTPLLPNEKDHILLCIYICMY